MNRAIVISVLLASAPLTLACEKSGADTQSEVSQAQQNANRQIGQANAQATQAQAQADQAIASAQLDFMQLRENYRHKMQGNLDALDKSIADLNAEAMTVPAKKSALQSTLPGIRAQRDAFVRDFRTLDDTNMTTFDGTKARLDKEWSDLKTAVDKMS